MERIVTLRSLVESLAPRGEAPALVAFKRHGSETWSYEKLFDSAVRLAAGLQQGALKPGEPAVLMAPNRPEWVAACLGVMAAGGVVVPLDVQLGDDTLGKILADAEPKVVFTSKEFAARFEKLTGSRKPTIALLDADESEERSWCSLLSDEPADLPRPKPEDFVTMFYTSGTTGPPKGVPLTHANIAFQLNSVAAAKIVTPTDRLILPLPFHHVYPFVIGTLTPLALGLPIILPHSLTGPEIVRALREGEATVLAGVPRLYRALISGVESRLESAGRIRGGLMRNLLALSIYLRKQFGWRVGKVLLAPLHRKMAPSLRVAASGGAALETELSYKIEGLGWKIATAYGLTETSPLLTIDPPGVHRIGTVGKAFPEVELRVAEIEATEDEEENGAREKGATGEGEIQARGPGVFQGYRNQPEKTRESFTEDGWFRTGDLGFIDDDGYLTITGRASTLIVMEGGKKVQPDNLEDAYAEHPFIGEIGVLKKDRKLVGLIVADINEIQKAGKEDVEPAVRAALDERFKALPSYQRLTDFAITREPLPRTRLGKIRRHLLVERYDRAKSGDEAPAQVKGGPISPDEMSQEDRALLEHRLPREVWEWIAGRFPERRITPDTSLGLDLGVDSMEWLNLTLEIRERMGVEIGDEAIARIETIRDLMHEVEESAEAGETVDAAPPLENPEEALSDQQRAWLKPLNKIQLFFAWILYLKVKFLMSVFYRIEVRGLEKLPADGPFVITPNHTSYLDPFAVVAALGFKRLRRTRFAGWTGIAFANPLFRFASRLAQAVPIDAERGLMSSLAFGAAVLKNGENLVWFPEGMRSPKGNLLPFKGGLGLILENFPDVRVVPAFIEGAFEAWPVGKSLPQPGKLRVTFGDPIRPRELESRGEGEQPRERMMQSLHSRVSELITSA